jgi:hypothetical protein
MNEPTKAVPDAMAVVTTTRRPQIVAPAGL